MKSTRNVFVFLLAGIFAISAAWWFRQHTLKLRQASRRQVQQASHSNTVAAQAQMATLQRQAANLEARVAAHPTDVPARQALLMTYQQLGQVDKAMAQLETLVRLQPTNQQAWLALANGWLALKQWPQAEQTFYEMTRRWPKEHLNWQGMAAAQYHQGHFEEAAMAARMALSLQPNNASDQFLMASALLEYAAQYPQPQLHSAALDLARKELEHLTQVWPNTGDLYLRLGRICIATRDATAAIHYMEQAARLLPNRTDVPLFQAKAYTLSRNQQAARTVLEQGVKHNPNDADLCDALGQIVQTSADPNADQQALALFRKAVQFAPHNERFQERYGTACLRANQLDPARQAFETATQINPNRAYPFQQLASIYARLRDPKRADEAAKRAQTLNASTQELSHLEAIANTRPKDVSLHLTLADRYLSLGERGAARNEYLSMLQIDPQNRHARQSLAALDTSQGGTMAAMSPSTP